MKILDNGYGQYGNGAYAIHYGVNEDATGIPAWEFGQGRQLVFATGGGKGNFCYIMTDGGALCFGPNQNDESGQNSNQPLMGDNNGEYRWVMPSINFGNPAGVYTTLISIGLESACALFSNFHARLVKRKF